MDCSQSLRVGVTICCYAALGKRLKSRVLSACMEELTILSGHAGFCRARHFVMACTGGVTALGS